MGLDVMAYEDMMHDMEIPREQRKYIKCYVCDNKISIYPCPVCGCEGKTVL